MMRGALIALCALGAGLPGLSSAEGARQVLSCTSQQRCTLDDECYAQNSTVEFTFAPVELHANGSGRATVSYDGATYDGTIIAKMKAVGWVDDAFEWNLLTEEADQKFTWFTPLNEQGILGGVLLTCIRGG